MGMRKMERQDEIRAIAYCLWEEEGRPTGKDLEHYYRAETIYQQQQHPVAGNVITSRQEAGREVEAHEGHHHQVGHHRRRRGEHHQSN
jgi:hypothetical protein